MLIEYKIESTKDSLSIKWLEFSAFGMLAGIQSMLGKDDPARQPARPKKKKKLAKMWTAIASNNCLENIWYKLH